MEKLFVNIENVICGLPLVLVLMISHIFFTFKLKFPQKNIIKGIRYIFEKKTQNGITSFKSLMTILAGTLGTGNIIGVASAIIIGGPGSIFWMFISGILAISTKYAETYIVLKYKKKKNKKNIGGAMYILKERLDNKFLAVIFSVFLILSTFCMGAMIQSNAIILSVNNVFNISPNIIAIVVSILCLYVVFGNEKRIANISSVLIPIATIMYMLSCIVLLFIFKDNILDSIKIIIINALSIKSVSGAFIGISIKVGLSKGLFTNEAGIGTSPIFDINVEENDIKKQSIISSISVFIDTVVLCTITGIIFVASGLYTTTNSADILSSLTFSMLPFGKYILMFFLTVFAISTIPCSCYYGWSAINFLFKNKKIYEILYKLLYIIFIYIGGILNLNSIWAIASICNAFLAFPNIYMLFKLKDEIK